METILIHVSEFGSWVSSNRLNIDLRRIIPVKNDDINSFLRLLDGYGNIRTSEPEAYIVARLKNCWRKFILRPSNLFSGAKVALELSAVEEFQALTQDAQLRLNSQTERLSISLSTPEYEIFWREFQSRSQLIEARESGFSFLEIYSFPSKLSAKYLDISDSLLNNLLTRISDYKSERTLEGLKGLAEYGPTEFGMRISSAHDESWRNNDERYVRFRQIRSERLSNKPWNEVCFLEFPDLVDSILSFANESKIILGIPPLAGVSFFKFYAEFILQGRKLNLEGINKEASSMLSLGYEEDCFSFIFMLGAAIGSEHVAAIKYGIFRDSFSVFNQDKFLKANEFRNINLFRVAPIQNLDNNLSCPDKLDIALTLDPIKLVDDLPKKNEIIDKEDKNSTPNVLIREAPSPSHDEKPQKGRSKGVCKNDPSGDDFSKSTSNDLVKTSSQDNSVSATSEVVTEKLAGDQLSNSADNQLEIQQANPKSSETTKDLLTELNVEDEVIAENPPAVVKKSKSKNSEKISNKSKKSLINKNLP